MYGQGMMDSSKLEKFYSQRFGHVKKTATRNPKRTKKGGKPPTPIKRVAVAQKAIRKSPVKKNGRKKTLSKSKPIKRGVSSASRGRIF